MARDGQFCTFFVNGLYLGIEVEQVQEVIRYQPLTSVPLSPAVVGGLMNLRGQIVTAIDLRRRLGLATSAPAELPINVVIRAEDGAVSLLVDEIGDVIDIRADAFEPPPETLSGDARAYIRGAYKLKDRLLLVLDTERALERADGNAN